MAAVAAAGLLALTACGDGDSDGDFSSLGDGQEAEDGGTDGETGGENTDPSGDSLAGLSAEEILARAEEALQSVDSMRMATLGDASAASFGIDLHMDRAGSCVGSVSQPGVGGVEILVREDDEVWMKPDTAFWQSQLGVADAGVVSLFDGSYLYGSTTDPELGQMAGTCALEALLADMTSTDGSGGSGPTEVGAETEHNGIPAIPISGTDETGARTTMLVAAEGEPYPLLFSGESDGVPMEMELTDFNEPVEIVEPPADQVLNIAEFRTGMTGQ
jgi:hypothetical protein